jgi:nitronate monooxygenase
LLLTPVATVTSICSGTGVGLVREVRPAGEIVREVREEAIKRIRALQGVIDG